MLVGAGGGEDAACGDELPAVEQPAEFLIPFVGLFAFDRRDAARDALHHLFRHRLDGFGDVLGETVDLCAVFQLDGDAARAAGGFGVHTADDADLALAGLAIDADDHHVAGRERPLLHIFEGVAIQKNLLPKLRQLVVVNHPPGVAHIGVRN